MIQYDFGKTVQEGQFERTGSLNRPPDVLLNAVANLKARHLVDEPALAQFWDGLGFHVSGFGAAFWGALVVSVVSTLLGILIREPAEDA